MTIDQLVTKALVLAGIVLEVSACTPRVSQTRAAVDQAILGTAQSFAVLGGSTVTNTGATTVHGDLGVDPGLAVSGFPPGLVLGGTYAGDAVALSAQNDTTVAYVALAGQAPTAELTGQDLGGMTLTSGVYHFSTSAQLTGTLTLDAQGDPNAVFVFQIGSTLTTASNSSVLVINGGSDCNVYYQVGSSATLGTTTAFKGNVLALTSITLNTNATVSGRMLARNGAVTLDTNTISTLDCAGTGAVDGGGGVDGGAPIDGKVETPVDAATDTTTDAGACVDAPGKVDAPPIDASDCVDAPPIDAPVDAPCETP